MSRSSLGIFMIGVVLLATIGGIIYILSFGGRRTDRQAEIEHAQNPATHSQSIDAKIASLEHLWVQYPTHAPIALELGGLYAARKMHEEAVQYYRAALPLTSAPLRHNVRVNLAKELSAMGKVQEARREMMELLVEAPDHPAGLFNLGAIEANAGRREEAEQAWNRLLVAHPEDSLAAKARRNLGSLLYKGPRGIE